MNAHQRGLSENLSHYEGNHRFWPTGFWIERIAFESKYAKPPEPGGKIRFGSFHGVRFS